jgi:hypothetical protein
VIPDERLYGEVKEFGILIGSHTGYYRNLKFLQEIVPDIYRI